MKNFPKILLPLSLLLVVSACSPIKPNIDDKSETGNVENIVTIETGIVQETGVIDDIATDEVNLTGENQPLIVTGDQSLIVTGENSTGKIEMDDSIEEKVDKLIEERKREATNESGMTEKDIDLINNVLNLVTDSVKTGNSK